MAAATMPANRVGVLREPADCSRCGVPMPSGTAYGWAPSTGARFHADASQCNGLPLAAPAPAPRPPAPATPNPADALQGLAGLLLPYIEAKLAGAVDPAQVRDIAETVLSEQLPILTAKLKRELTHTEVLEVRTAAAPAITFEVFHPSLKRALYWAAKRKHVYLFGPRGSGKSEMALQIAKALNLRFYSIQLNQQTSESKIAGLRDAMGVVHTTPFIEAYRNGGLFYLSEADNASGNFLTGLNTALANGYYTTAAGETFTMHADFRFLADGNTIGHGHDATYSSRGKLDAATLDRWVYVHVPYDLPLESKLALRRNPKAEPWVKWIQAVRAYCEANKLESVSATPRSAITGAEALADGELSIGEIAEDCVWKGLHIKDRSIRDKVLANCPLPTVSMKYTPEAA